MCPMSGNNFMQLHHYFERSVDNFPGNIALICDNAIISYQELEFRSNQLAHFLHQQNIANGSIVGIFLERSIDCYIAILATLKVGAAYVPIEVEYPDERINYIFSDLPFNLVLTSSLQAQKALAWPKTVIMDKITDTLAIQPTKRFTTSQTEQTNDKLCYVIYTSGSTGKPKGVEVAHGSICHYVGAASHLYSMTESDRVYQGFSLAFDASLEELWMAFANGAALVACTEKEIRSGVGLVSFLKHHNVNVFSTVPTLLATLEEQLPELRLLILGGETCPSNLVKRWSRPGLKIMNTYGPTEATVIATYSECHPEKEVTIGQPLAGYEVFLLDEHLQEVNEGEEGEICIGGLGLARGYVNKPEFTADKFILNPKNNNQRLYKTGDLALRDANGDLHFVGRIDDQVKLRGFRIELNEIETVVLEYPGINQAIVSLQTIEQPILVAYLLLDKNKKLDQTAFKSFLRSRLPDYMIPAAIEVLESFPLLASGKVNRKELPKPTKIEFKETIKSPTTELEKEIASIWEGALNCTNISIDADFFYDLGGHSLHAAKIISNLRKIPELKNISILDLYKNPSIEQIVQKFIKSSAENEYREEAPVRNKYRAPKWKYYLCGLAQFFGILFQYAVGSWQLFAVYAFYFWSSSEYSLTSRESQITLLAMCLFLPLLSLTIPVLMKWLLLGRVKPGTYPLWGWFYFRWWFVHRLVGSAFSFKNMAGTPLINIYYRLLGARIGKNCHIGTTDIFTHDLVSIGDNSSLGAESKLTGYIVEDGWLKIGSINIGDHCYVGSRSVIGLNTEIGDNVVLEEMSMLPDNALIPQGLYYAGSPALPSSLPAEHVTRKKIQMEESTLLEKTCFGILHYLGVVFLMVIGMLCFLPGLSFVNYFYDQSNYFITLFLATPIGAILCLGMHYLCIIVCKKLIMDKVKPGQYPVKSFYYLRYWIILQLLDNEHVSVMSDSLYLPMFLRLLGAKLGKRVEMGETPLITPDLVTIEDGGFAASSVALGWPQIHGDSVYFAPVTIGKKAFVGNVSFLPAGKSIGDGGLLGCLSITPTDNKAEDSNSSWLGSPALFLPKRELFGGYSDEETYNPTKRVYCIRLLIEFVRIIIPTTFSLIILFNLIYVMDFMVRKFSLLSTAFVLPFAELCTVATLIAVLVGLKWTIQGKLKPLAKPLWDIFIWKNDLVEFTYGYFMCPYFIDFALGTPFVLLVPKCLGAKVGKQVFCDTNAIAEFDLISIGDYACINNHTLIQTHLYEDRIFKVSNLTISSGCNVGVSSIVLYNTMMEENSSLGNLSLLMKGECLPSNTEWEGIPAQSRLHKNNLRPVLQSSTAAVAEEEVVSELL
jgi:non-ribosomal peptide synthetase-like protein